MATDIFGNETEALGLALDNNSIQTWSDDKRKDFTQVFDKRVKVSVFLLKSVAQLIHQHACNLNLASRKDLNDISINHDRYQQTVGDRPVDDLNKIARDKADEVIKSMPAVSKAMEIIDPEAAKDMKTLEGLSAKGTKFLDELSDISEPLVMGELDQDMTIGAFRKMIKDRESKRDELLKKLNDIGEESSLLEKKIAKKLYHGIPGFSDAIIDVIKQHIDKANAMETFGRRVSEKVMFGDSQAALELLKSFENDEVEVSANIKAKFDEALDKLKLSVKKLPKKTAKKSK